MLFILSIHKNFLFIIFIIIFAELYSKKSLSFLLGYSITIKWEVISVRKSTIVKATLKTTGKTLKILKFIFSCEYIFMKLS